MTAIDLQLPDGSFPAGHNGPYRDPETPVRNTSHWLVTLCDLYRESGERIWYTAAQRAVDYLLSEAARPMRATFPCRSNPRKDFCNGVMGQAWVMEGLVAAARALERQDAEMLARELFFLHPFLEECAVWERVEVDGTRLSPDTTFNHQLWFAAVGATLADAEADRRALRFLERVGTRVETYRSGVIHHRSPVIRFGTAASLRPRALVRTVRSAGSRWRFRQEIRRKSIGYHGFNLYGYGLLKQRYPEHPFWKGRTMKRMLHVPTTVAFKRELEANPYGYPYNPPGIEMAYAGEVFGLSRAYATSWLQAQVARTYDGRTGSILSRGVPDPLTASARIYEATRLREQYRVSLDD